MIFYYRRSVFFISRSLDIKVHNWYSVRE